jgi:ABC-type multidrug transport system ATPase subunit
VTGRAPPAVRLRAVSKRYGRRRQVLRDVDLTVWPGDVVAITGVNGSGKSTLLRIMARVSLPSAGQLSHGARVIGYVPERFPSHEWLSASAYLRHMGRIRGLTADAAARRADDLLDRLALAGNRSVAMRKLSKGNAQKVALAQALLTPPDLLVLDEPWSGLDASVHGTLWELIAGIAAGGAAVVFTDHRESVVSASATRICTIDAGLLTERGPLPAASPPTAGSPPTAITPHAAERPPTAGSPPAAMSPPASVMKACFEAPAGAAEPPERLDWRALPGVLAAAERSGEVEVLVARDSHDALLVRAITGGWSVTAVHPAPEPAVCAPRRPN